MPKPTSTPTYLLFVEFGIFCSFGVMMLAINDIMDRLRADLSLDIGAIIAAVVCATGFTLLRMHMRQLEKTSLGITLEEQQPFVLSDHEKAVGCNSMRHEGALMGQALGRHLDMLFATHSSDTMHFFDLVDLKTGSRVRIRLSNTSAQHEEAEASISREQSEDSVSN